ncbi:nuclear cap-binding protein subunit 3-like isoform X1 [Neodiprion fabricii]|uniref:nuclear cap-binding protein subunit 3-like isoform X1 n=2 Tax=Neodiprion fabricii TaxID=2872261 RepID=UPI001ED97B2D|nr:nuclear cap-binding protein subunit 3-like isoform X1 [Neodiprion fabricii]
MNQFEEPMDVDTSVSLTEIDKSIDSKSFISDLSYTKLSTEDNVSTQEIPPDEQDGVITSGDTFSTEEKIKLEKRAKRFGLIEDIKNSSEFQEPELYNSLGITEENDTVKNLRLNVLHMRGTEEMSTTDVFKYFEDFAPASIEWINDVSCNVVWLDNLTAARALLRLSKKITGLGETIKAEKNSASNTPSRDDDTNAANEECVIEMSEDDIGDGMEGKKTENSIHSKDINCPLPPGLWRKGIDCPKSKCILLRFATRADKKQPKAEKMSDYYKKYGNPNFGGIKGILTESRKRMYKELKHGRKLPKRESSVSKEADKNNSKNPWGSLSQTWGINDFTEEDCIAKNITKDQSNNVKERLGLKPISKAVHHHSEESESSSQGESDEEWCKRSKVMRMRMHADDEEEKVQKRRLQLKHQAARISASRTDDLRSRLCNSRNQPDLFRGAIQVVVTNNQIVPDSLKKSRSEDECIEEVQEEEEEEGEIVDTPEEAVDVQDESLNDTDDDQESDESERSEKEVQGPRGSVIKVVQHKPRVASTVWARLNNKKTECGDEPKQRRPTTGDLRDTLRGDLRSRLGKQTRGRSPLRIEVKNDKYASDTDSE